MKDIEIKIDYNGLTSFQGSVLMNKVNEQTPQMFSVLFSN